MPTSIDELLKAALELSQAERSQLAGELLDSLDELPGFSGETSELQAELARRSGDVEDAVTWETLRDELKVQS